MNTATLLHIKGEFESLLDSMKTFCEQPHAVEPQTIEQIKAFYNKLICVNNPLENERKNHQAWGELDKLELMFANESDQNTWYQRREKLEKLMDKMIENSSLLMQLCQIIQSNPSQKTFDLVLQLLREIISFIQKELASFENEDSHLNYSIKDFQRLEASLNKFVSQLNQVQGQETVKLIDELKTKVEYYQLLTQEKSENFATQELEVKPEEELEFKSQKAEEIQQQITELKRQHQEQLQNREAELSDKVNQLQKQITELKRQHEEKLQNRENELQHHINELQKQITELKRQHQEKLQNREAQLSDQINQLQKQITELKRQHQEKLQNREAELSVKYQEQIRKREAELQHQINELQKQITQLKSQQTEKNEERTAQLVTQINQLQQQIAEVQ
ncbi:MAG: hypothetical protein VKK42_15770, partial [Lyngbya sp.]|nr:hypothetical protein [Lyngbya sp.]